jgi:hypothetical protein
VDNPVQERSAFQPPQAASYFDQNLTKMKNLMNTKAYVQDACELAMALTVTIGSQRQSVTCV